MYQPSDSHGEERKKEDFQFLLPPGLQPDNTFQGCFLLLLDRKSDEDEGYVVLKA